jgi:tRNA(fMet)-specific endonuclease VapC
MTRFLLDTNMMGHFINRRRGVDARVRQARSEGAVIGTCVPVVCELFFGVENSVSREKNRQRLIRSLSAIPCWPLDRKAAEEYGRLAAELKRVGRRIQQIEFK